MKLINGIFVCTALLLSACGGDNGSNNENNTAFTPKVTWSNCLEYAKDLNPGFEDIITQFECSKTELPLNWDETKKAKIDYFVRRLPASTASRGQLWILPGGPGIAGDDWELALGLAEGLPDLDIYMPDHRGTGRSTFLACSPEQEGGIFDKENLVSGETCKEYLEETWGKDLQYFSTTQATKDVGELIKHLSNDNDEVYLYGSSYGTLWGHRYLHLYPDQASGVFIDSVCSPTGCYQQKGYYENADKVGRNLLQICDEDLFCRDKIGGNAVVYLENLFEMVDNGHCEDLNLSSESLQFITGAVIDNARRAGNTLPALLYRINRCTEADVTAIEHFLSTDDSEEEGGDNNDELFIFPESPALTYNILFSEIWDENSTGEALENGLSSALFVGDGYGEEEIEEGELQKIWPKYDKDRYITEWANTTTPLLIINGTLDPTTPLYQAKEFEEQFLQAYQQFVPMPYAGHETLIESPVIDSDEPCSLTIAFQFLTAPTEPLDISCTDNIEPLNFEGDIEAAMVFFNTADFWENP